MMAMESKSDVEQSTTPLGSYYYRHLAFDFGQDMNKLVRYEERGFGRAEILTLILLSKITGAPLKDYGNRRLKMDKSLKELTEEAGLHYVTLYKTVAAIKTSLEEKGDSNLPPPVYRSPDFKKPESPIDEIKKEID